jgi:hypothetical protein
MSGAGFDNRSIRILVIIYLILDFPAGQVNSFCCFNLTGRTGKFIGQENLFKGFSRLHSEKLDYLCSRAKPGD